MISGKIWLINIDGFLFEPWRAGFWLEATRGDCLGTIWRLETWGERSHTEFWIFLITSVSSTSFSTPFNHQFTNSNYTGVGARENISQDPVDRIVSVFWWWSKLFWVADWWMQQRAWSSFGVWRLTQCAMHIGQRTPKVLKDARQLNYWSNQLWLAPSFSCGYASVIIWRASAVWGIVLSKNAGLFYYHSAILYYINPACRGDGKK